MFERAFKRLFLVLFPIGCLALALILIQLETLQPNTISNQTLKNTACDFSLGVSFFSQPKHRDFSNGVSYLLSKKALMQKVKKVKDMPQKKLFYVFPLVLSKDKQWIISQKPFFILPSGERKQISHLSSSEIQKFHKNFQTLNWDQVLSYLPTHSNFLLEILGTDRQRIVKNLDKITTVIKGTLYLSSSNEKLLNDLILLNPQRSFKILHSFKTFVRLEMLSMLSFQNIKGEGLIVPAMLSSNSFNSLKLAQQENKLLFFQKDPPYTTKDLKWIQQSQAVISSQAHLAIRSIKNKNSCFVRN